MFEQAESDALAVVDGAGDEARDRPADRALRPGAATARNSTGRRRELVGGIGAPHRYLSASERENTPPRPPPPPQKNPLSLAGEGSDGGCLRSAGRRAGLSPPNASLTTSCVGALQGRQRHPRTHRTPHKPAQHCASLSRRCGGRDRAPRLVAGVCRAISVFSPGISGTDVTALRVAVRTCLRGVALGILPVRGDAGGDAELLTFAAASDAAGAPPMRSSRPCSRLSSPA